MVVVEVVVVVVVLVEVVMLTGCDLMIFNPAHQSILLIWKSSELQLGFCQWQPFINSLDGFVEVFRLSTTSTATLHTGLIIVGL